MSASGGGGGGTDDQTAAEVPVTTTNFNGNLSGTDNDVQAALETIDDFTLGGGGGGSGTSVDGVDVQYVTNTRAVFVDVQQADGNDFSDSANLPLGTTILPGLDGDSNERRGDGGNSNG